MKRRLLSVFIFLFIFSLISSHVNLAFAQFQGPDASTSASNYLNIDPNVPNNITTNTQVTIINVLTAVSCFLTGENPTSPDEKCLDVNPTTKKLGYVDNNGGIISIAGDMIGFTFKIPVSSTQYAKDVADNFGIAKKTYAQASGGAGYEGLRPVLSIWQTFRNITYLIFVILFVVIGLGIMLRVKIDPRTVMTLQNQIPKIIVALVLVTLSYAIAGFLIDLMYLSMYVVFNVFAPHISDTTNLTPVRLQGANPITAVGAIGGFHIAKTVAGSVGGIIGGLFDGTVGTVIAGVIGSLIGGAAGGGLSPLGAAGALIGGITGAVFGTKLLSLVGSMIVFLVVAIAILSALFRLWFLLIKSYVYVLIAVVFSPFYISLGLIPGRSGVGAWIRNLLSNLVVFPITLTMLLLGKVLVGGFDHATNTFTPPLIGDISPDGIGALIGLGIILMLPEVANMAKETLKSQDSKFTTSIGKSVAVGTSIATSGPRFGWQTLMRHSNAQTGFEGGPLYKRLANLPDSGPSRVIKQVFGIGGHTLTGK